MSIQNDVLNAVVSEIQGLSLSDFGEIRLRTSPRDESGWFYPGITVWPQYVREEHPGTNTRDDMTTAVGVTMVVNNDDDVTEQDIIGVWKQSIRHHFIHQRLSGVSNACECLVRDGKMYDDKPDDQYVSELTVRVIVRESRT